MVCLYNNWYFAVSEGICANKGHPDSHSKVSHVVQVNSNLRCTNAFWAVASSVRRLIDCHSHSVAVGDFGPTLGDSALRHHHQDANRKKYLEEERQPVPPAEIKRLEESVPWSAGADLSPLLDALCQF